jgi:hypothetical protein
MDPRRFDSLAKSLSRSSTRRSIARLLAAMPLGVVLTSRFADAPDATAEDDDHGSSHRRHRRKARQDPGQGKENRKGERKGKDKNKGKRGQKCVPDPLTHTCAGRCARVTNNCGAQVECGSCACTPPCPECQTCNARTSACIPLPASDACGPAPTCQSGVATPIGSCNGAGSCQPGTPVACSPYRQCDGDACATTCEFDTNCEAGFFCNENDQCVSDLDNGADCDRPRQCSSGNCVAGVCCNTECPDACMSCSVPNNVGTCTAVPDGFNYGETCGAGRVCCNSICKPGNTCCAIDCGTCVACVNGTCDEAAADNTPCHTDTSPLSAFCCGGECVCNFLTQRTCRYSPMGGTCCCSGASQICCDEGGSTSCRNSAICP